MRIAAAPSLAFQPNRSRTPLPPGPADKVEAPDIDHKEQAARYTNNILVHLLMSDVPAIVTTVANYSPMPSSWGPALNVLNFVNVGTSAIALAADLRETFGTLKNPEATRLDKVLDVAHLVSSDILGTASGFIPFFANVHGPLAGPLFVGGQALLVATDIAKTIYDVHRKGQQSAHHPQPTPLSQALAA